MAVEVFEVGWPCHLMGSKIPRREADAAGVERRSKRLKIGRGRRRLFANRSVGRFSLVLRLRHFHIHRATVLFDPQRRVRARWQRSSSPTRGPCMRILPSGPVESSVGSRLASNLSCRQAAFLVACAHVTSRTTTADLFTWYCLRRGWFRSRADSDCPGARKRTANGDRRPHQADSVPEANRAASIARLPL